MASGNVTASAEDSLLRGREHYDQGRFENALEASTTAIALANDHGTAITLDALDLRTATYIRLEKLNAARKDAMSMIRADRHDGRGYMWSGQIEQLDGNAAAAAQWLNHGLKRVPKSDPYHEYLEVRLRKAVTYGHRTDPATLLPPEIMELVLSYLDFREITRALRISKAWTNALKSIRPLCEVIDYRDASCEVTSSALSAALERVQGTAKVFHMVNLSNAAKLLLISHLATWQDYTVLQTLSLETTTRPELLYLRFPKFPLRYLQISDEEGVEMATVMSILKKCKSLQHAKFHNILVPGECYPDVVTSQDFREGVSISHELKTLHLNCQHGPLGYVKLDSVFSCFPELEEIECSYSQVLGGKVSCDLSSLKNLQRVRFHNVYCIFPRLPPSVEAWGNTSCSFRTPHSAPFYPPEDQYRHLSKLRILQMSNISGPIKLQHFMSLGNNPSLTHLDWTGTKGFGSSLGDTYHTIGSEWQALENLLVLCISGTVNLGILHALLVLPRLEELRLESSTLKSVILADAFRSSECRLQYVHLKDCPRVTPYLAELTELALSKGINLLVETTTEAT